MEIVIAPSAEVGVAAAERIHALADAGALATLGLATGSSPQPVYRALDAARIRAERLRGVALDEYVGLPAGHPERYRAVLERDVVVPLGLDPRRLLVPDGGAEDLGRAADEFEAAIAGGGGVDLQLLGIGRNGHIGFNEPGSPAGSRTRVVELAAHTRADNARFFPSADDVPTHALTQGIATILSARRLLLVATGAAKAPAVAAAVDGAVSAEHPASMLRRHPHVTLVLDDEAASLLRARRSGSVG